MAITYLFLLGGSLASIYTTYNKQKQKIKELIDYDLVMITMPMTISGTIFGVKIMLSRSFSIIFYQSL